MTALSIIVGGEGQDGRLLREHLRRGGREVMSIGRCSTQSEPPRELRPVDILDATAVTTLISAIRPTEVYYLPAYHHAAEAAPPEPGELLRRSFSIHVDGLVNFLEAIRTTSPTTRLFYAGSSHIFGEAAGPMQDESTPLQPRCAYGISKAAGVHCCRWYRSAHGVFASVGILYNHESPLRREQFVSQKIVRAAVAAARGRREKLVLGDLSAQIDWGYAPDFVDAMTRIMALKQPDDFVVATGEAHSVGEFAGIAYEALGLNAADHVEEDRSILRKHPLTLIGESSKLRAAAGWKPSTTFVQMVQALVRAAQVDADQAKGAGHPKQ
jgi:GDPmannose 4,6-dehydratase